ncbi:MAG: prolyl-tRNA synthetase associated domain-containing protein [Mogibacterium sp.]|nr:prolyl-tRNA synthetase associated domain-containing protein [Mogibacterium sp.]
MHYGKKEIYELLTQKGIRYRAIEHEAVYTMAETDALGLPEEGNIAKNLFLRDKKKNFFVIVVAGEERMDLKLLGEQIGAKGLSFAQEKYMEELLGLTPGAVSPLGALNDSAHRVRVYVDERFRGGVIAVHPNENTASVWLDADDLVRLLQESGTEVQYIHYEI